MFGLFFFHSLRRINEEKPPRTIPGSAGRWVSCPGKVTRLKASLRRSTLLGSEQQRRQKCCEKKLPFPAGLNASWKSANPTVLIFSETPFSLASSPPPFLSWSHYTPMKPPCINPSIIGTTFQKLGANKESPSQKMGREPGGAKGRGQLTQPGAAGAHGTVSTSPSFSSPFLSSPHPKAASGLSGRPISVSFLCHFTHSAFPGRAEGTFDSAAS